MVYDLGGGTFDVSIIEMGDGVTEVLATNGDTHLGGDDFDQRIIDWMADAFQTENGIDLRKDKMAAQRLKEAAEKAKIELSSAMSSQINLPFIINDKLQANPTPIHKMNRKTGFCTYPFNLSNISSISFLVHLQIPPFSYQATSLRLLSLQEPL